MMAIFFKYTLFSLIASVAHSLLAIAVISEFFLLAVSLILLFRLKKMSSTNKLLWLLNILIFPLSGSIFLFIYLLIQKNKAEKTQSLREGRAKEQNDG